MNSGSDGSAPRRPPRIGLALGSGSARGLAHIGVIQALREHGIPVHLVAGTSIGAVIGAVFASGNIEKLRDTYLGFDWRRVAYFMDVVFPRSGLIDGKRLSDFVREFVRSEQIENLPLPFTAVAADLATGEAILFRRGDLINAVRASFSVPGMFTPVRFAGRVLVDGGLVDPVPVGPARGMGADVVIAVDLNLGLVGHGMGVWEPEPGAAGHHPAGGAVELHSPTRFEEEASLDPDSAGAAPGGMEPLGDALREALARKGPRGLFREAMERIERGLKGEAGGPAEEAARPWLQPGPVPNIFEVILASINIMSAQITLARLQEGAPNLLIRPPVEEYRFLDYHRAAEIIPAGYEAATRALAEVDPETLASWRGSSPSD